MRLYKHVYIIPDDRNCQHDNRHIPNQYQVGAPVSLKIFLSTEKAPAVIDECFSKLMCN